MKIYNKIVNSKVLNKKSFAVLLDPDKLTTSECIKLVNKSQEAVIDYFFIGGSLITRKNFNDIIKVVKDHSDIPVVIFPGSNLQIDENADAILLLSLISGRNPEFLIGQHVIAAPLLKESGIEVVPTGYMLVDCGKPTTVSYISNTTPIPHDKPSVASCTALAGEMLGMRLTYLDGGSGAKEPISPEMIAMTRKTVNTPIIVGGGIDTKEKAAAALKAGADIIVVGNAIESNPDFLNEVSETVKFQNLPSDIHQ
ncbi:geranylgeranylglyceryl/heptaprenylglyceryl phosphate synthase [Cytophagaceae bacterium ABcell3]|nr:geranylgeranylglyceryl/heptaprenylglyceryl phosphate synthase [Cytophagaceae bacterium ABcell3]